MDATQVGCLNSYKKDIQKKSTIDIKKMFFFIVTVSSQANIAMDTGANTINETVVLYRSLFGAIERDDTQKALNIITHMRANDFTLNCINQRHEHPLHVAARTGSINMLELLVGNGALCNPTNRQNYTPFMVAAIYGHASFIKYFLQKLIVASKKKKYINTCTLPQKETPLLLAVENRRVEVVDILLAEGADPTSTDMFGFDAFKLTMLLDLQGPDIEVMKNINGMLRRSVKLEESGHESPPRKKSKIAILLEEEK